MAGEEVREAKAKSWGSCAVLGNLALTRFQNGSKRSRESPGRGQEGLDRGAATARVSVPVKHPFPTPWPSGPRN